MHHRLNLTPPLRLFMVLIVVLAALKPASAADKKSTATPVAAPTPANIDPNTGLPLPAPWMDLAWKEPNKTLPKVAWDGLPVSEIANMMREQFQDAFDILIPGEWRDPLFQNRAVEPGSFAIRLKLKNVTASEIFNAMNMVFEAENLPIRWELRMNGNRPIALLRVLPDRLPQPANEIPPDPPKRMVYFVGDLLGDENTGMTMDRLVKTVSEVYEMSYGKHGNTGRLQFHKDAQLLIFTGTVDQINFIQSTISALKGKAELERHPRPEQSPKSEATKTP